MEFYTCTCGCTVFETVKTYQYAKNEFSVDSRSKEIPAEVFCIPVARCMKCGIINVPPTSLAGISALDKRVKGYAALVDAVEYQNNTIKDSNVYPSMIASVEAKVDYLSSIRIAARIEALEKKDCACSVEKEDVQTTTRGRKKSEAVVS